MLRASDQSQNASLRFHSGRFAWFRHSGAGFEHYPAISTCYKWYGPQLIDGCVRPSPTLMNNIGRSKLGTLEAPELAEYLTDNVRYTRVEL